MGIRVAISAQRDLLLFSLLLPESPAWAVEGPMADFAAGYAFPPSDIVTKPAIPLHNLPVDFAFVRVSPPSGVVPESPGLEERAR